MAPERTFPVLLPVSGLPGEGILFGIPCLEDNIAWGLADARGDVLLVDVPEAEPVEAFLRARSLRLDTVMITHGHRDHVAGLAELLVSRPARVFAAPALGLRGASPLHAGTNSLAWNQQSVRVLDTSGHSDCDFSFYFPDAGICFCGDTLFAGGCGRLFAGPPERMWESLCALRALPDNTLLCPGHEYALENYRFASGTFPGVPRFAEALQTARKHNGAHTLFAPVTVGDQSRTNPMLMADHPEIAAALGMRGEPSWAVFAEIRSRRSAF